MQAIEITELHEKTGLLTDVFNIQNSLAMKSVPTARATQHVCRISGQQVTDYAKMLYDTE